MAFPKKPSISAILVAATFAGSTETRFVSLEAFLPSKNKAAAHRHGGSKKLRPPPNTATVAVNFCSRLQLSPFDYVIM
jgi:hypothetical protein